MRYSSVGFASGVMLHGTLADPVQRHQLGTRINAVCNDYNTGAGYPNGGGAELIYARAAGAFVNGRLVHMDKDLLLLDVPITANTGRPVFAALNSFSATNIFGWVMAAGTIPLRFSVAATVGTVFSGTAGNVSPTAANGRQILGAHTLVAAAGTVVKSARIRNGSPRVEVNDVGGLYIGMTMSGTGITGTIIDMDAGANVVVLSANCSATSTTNMTGTHTGFGIVQLSHAFVQGQAV